MGNRIIRSGVYQIVNEVNGKFYIGSSKDIKNRWNQWRSYFKEPKKGQCILWDAVQKYGIENFTFIILEECELVKEVLLAREQFYIDTLKPIYNILPKAGSRLGSKGLTKRSPEAIAKFKATRQSRGTEWAQEAARKAKETLGEAGRKAAAAATLNTLGVDGIKARGQKIKAALNQPDCKVMRSASAQRMWDGRDATFRDEIAAKIAATQFGRGKEWLKARAIKVWQTRQAKSEVPLGIYYSANKGKWVATAPKGDGKKTHIGFFDTLEQATEAQEAFYATGIRPFERHPAGVHRSENGKNWNVRSLASKIGKSVYIGTANSIAEAGALQNDYHAKHTSLKLAA